MGRKRKNSIKIEKITQEEVRVALEESKNCLSSKSHRTFEKMSKALQIITINLEKQGARIEKLEKELRGIKSEKSSKLFEKVEKKNIKTKKNTTKKKSKGHGRNSAEKYTGAKKKQVVHEELKSGDLCEECQRGKIYKDNPGTFIHVEGRAPIEATVYEIEKYRCNLCGEIYEADLPDEVPSVPEKRRKYYDASAKSMIAILRYGNGLPLNRLEKLQASLGIPLPATTAWDKTQELANDISPIYEELKRVAAQGNILYNDDTGMKILETMKEIKKEVKEAGGKKTRTGIFTTGIVSTTGDKKVALFFTGRKHAGENFDELLKQRESDRSPPLQMSDGKSGNTLKTTSTIICNCNAHARRYFVDVSENFPEACSYVLLEVYRNIYKFDAEAKKNVMSAQKRLEYHQEKSAPIMEEFRLWLKRQFDEKLVEENSSLGKAINYVQKRWSELTRFLNEPGAPLDNNICERALKKAICHRKNSLFYKTANGASVGDLLMSIIHTCFYAGANPFDYITKLQRNLSKVLKEPTKWLPWNYSLQLNRSF